MPLRNFEDDMAEVAMKRAGHDVLRCPRCDKAIMDDVPICNSCGHKFGKYAPKFPWKTAIGILVIAALVVSFLLIF